MMARSPDYTRRRVVPFEAGTHAPDYLVVRHEPDAGCVLVTLHLTSHQVLTRLLKLDPAWSLEQMWQKGARTWDGKDSLGITPEEVALGSALTKLALNVCLPGAAYGARCLGPINPGHHERLKRYAALARKRGRAQQAIADNKTQPQYPLGTVALYGPNDLVIRHRTRLAHCRPEASGLGKVFRRPLFGLLSLQLETLSQIGYFPFRSVPGEHPTGEEKAAPGEDAEEGGTNCKHAHWLTKNEPNGPAGQAALFPWAGSQFDRRRSTAGLRRDGGSQGRRLGGC
jgi:hypothetical protein